MFVGMLLVVSAAIADTVDIDVNTGAWDTSLTWTTRQPDAGLWGLIPGVDGTEYKYGVPVVYDPVYLKSQTATEIRWGTDVYGNCPGCTSGYGWETAGPLTATVDEAFVLGNFTHYNYVVDPWSAITSAILNLSVEVLGEQLVLDPIIFNHTETPNTNNAEESRDIVTIDFSPVDYFLYQDADGMKYYLSVLGFTQESVIGKEFSDVYWQNDYLTWENAPNTTSLWAVITTQGFHTGGGCTPDMIALDLCGGNEVPEPGTIVLLGTGIIGLGLTVRRKLSKK